MSYDNSTVVKNKQTALCSVFATTSTQTQIAKDKNLSKVGGSCLIKDSCNDLVNRGKEGGEYQRDYCYFNGQLGQLFQGIRFWARRFSNFSHTRACKPAWDVDHVPFSMYDNAFLSSSEVDSYLADRVKRKDAFTSWLSTTLWRYVFSRYLFGMDKDQRRHVKAADLLLASMGKWHFLSSIGFSGTC